MTVKKYVVPKVDARGEDTIVGAEGFDSLLAKMVRTQPLPLSKLREEPAMLAARKPKKERKPR